MLRAYIVGQSERDKKLTAGIRQDLWVGGRYGGSFAKVARGDTFQRGCRVPFDKWIKITNYPLAFSSTSASIKPTRGSLKSSVKRDRDNLRTVARAVFVAQSCVFSPIPDSLGSSRDISFTRHRHRDGSNRHQKSCGIRISKYLDLNDFNKEKSSQTRKIFFVTGNHRDHYFLIV